MRVYYNVHLLRALPTYTQKQQIRVQLDQSNSKICELYKRTTNVRKCLQQSAALELVLLAATRR